jgi:hypothetical protein
VEDSAAGRPWLIGPGAPPIIFSMAVPPVHESDEQHGRQGEEDKRGLYPADRRLYDHGCVRSGSVEDAEEDLITPVPDHRR